MIEITNIIVEGFEPAIRGMRNSWNSWDKSDSCWCYDNQGNNSRCDASTCDEYCNPFYEIGENDLALMKKLVKAGTDHRKFLRMITVWCDIIAPLYWWKEFDTYKVGTVANSCSTMHCIANKEFTLDDFSCEKLINSMCMEIQELQKRVRISPMQSMLTTLECLNQYRELYLETENKKYWWQMIQLLPSSYHQKRTVMLNYEVLMNIYKARKNHKLNEWREFCKWVEKLSYMKELLVV